MHAKYGDRVAFLGVYVREAHPTDGWRMSSNDKAGVVFAQPKTTAERFGIAKQCSTALKMTIPLVVDDVNDRVGHLYSGMPDRLYLIDRSGKVAYKGGRGPFGFKPGELEQAINLLQLDESLQRSKPAAEGEPPLALLSDGQAWAALPEATTPKAGPLPGWAKALAGPLPRTTAAMLELDHIVRATPPVEAKLAAKVRWAAANANGCRAGEAIAVGDLLRAGGSAGDVTALVDDWDRLPPAERTTLRFARKLSRMASSVSDAEFAEVRAIHGDAGVVGLTLLLAYANFQDRLLLSLGLPADVLPPVSVKFARPYQGGVAASRALPSDPPPGPPVRFTDPNWLKVGADSLRAAMAGQKSRSPRVPVPEVSDKSPSKIRWSRTVIGYQPDIGKSWLNCLRTFEAEARQDRVFEESLFWVVTRTIDCFY